MDQSPSELEALVRGAGEWLRGTGPESDFVISSRIRLARNLAAFPFISRASPPDRVDIEQALRAGIDRSNLPVKLVFLDVQKLASLDRQFLVERQLISREMADAEGARGVAIDPREQVSLMINEEDHLRIQVMHSGFDLPAVWETARQVDDALGQSLSFAYSERWGFLTACPTNVGTGMRVSVMLHLPALVMTRQIEKVFRSLQKISLAVRGLYGEGSQAMGDFYQISNQITLGRGEEDLVRQVTEIVPVIVEYERQARQFLIKESRENLHDRVSRAYGILRTAQQISSEETMHLLSSVRMGVSLGLIEGLPVPKINELFLQTQPAHLQKLRGEELDSGDRNVERARRLRSQLSDSNGPAGSERN